MNRTVDGALPVHSVDPQNLIQKILRERIYESAFWKDHLLGFPLPATYERCAKLVYVGGSVGNQRPSPFLCCLLKLLQLGRRGWDEQLMRGSKYEQALGMLLFRMTEEDPASLYVKLEEFLGDRRRLKWRGVIDGAFSIRYMDEFAELLLGYHSEDRRVLDIQLPRIPARARLEHEGRLAARRPLLDEVEISRPAEAAQLDERPCDEQGKKKKKEKWKL